MLSGKLSHEEKDRVNGMLGLLDWLKLDIKTHEFNNIPLVFSHVESRLSYMFSEDYEKC